MPEFNFFSGLAVPLFKYLIQSDNTYQGNKRHSFVLQYLVLSVLELGTIFSQAPKVAVTYPLSNPSGSFFSCSDSAIPTKNVPEDMHTFQLSKVSLQLRVSQSVSDVRGYFCTSQPYKLQGNVCLKALQSLKITNFADGFFQIKLISFAIGLKTQTKLN